MSGREDNENCANSGKQNGMANHFGDDQRIDSNGISLADIFFTYMTKYRKNIAQYNADTGYKETYEELLKKCVRTALKLKESGVTKNDVITVCSYENEHSCVPFIATLFVGAKVATLHPDLSQPETIHLLKLVEPKVIFFSADVTEFIETCSKEAHLPAELVVFGASKRHTEFAEYIKPQAGEDTFKPLPRNLHETSIIAFSSGTTGYPKGVCLSDYCLVNQHFNPEDEKRFLSVALSYATLYWISGVIFLIKSVVYGGSRVLCRRFDASQSWKIIEKYKVNALYLSSSLARDFIDAQQRDYDTSSLILLILGADTVSYKLFKDITTTLPRTAILIAYSQTELGGGGFHPEAVSSNNIKEPSKNVLSIGKVAPDHSWKIVDPVTEDVLGPNQNGELRIKSRYVMNGYYKMDSSSSFDSEGYLKTGDLCFYDEDNKLYMESRIREMFKYRGWHILPTVVEEALMSHPAIEDAIVIGVPHLTYGHLPMGFIKLKKGYQNVLTQDIEKYVEEKLTDHHKLRAGIKFIQSIPYNVNGKKKRYELRQKVLNGEIKLDCIE